MPDTIITDGGGDGGAGLGLVLAIVIIVLFFVAGGFVVFNRAGPAVSVDVPKVTVNTPTS